MAVIPAKAGIHSELVWIPAFAGMTNYYPIIFLTSISRYYKSTNFCRCTMHLKKKVPRPPQIR